MNQIEISASAKINLSLDIKGLRPDGFHELEMIMQTVSLYDIIKMEKCKKGINLTNSDKSLPEDENNLAYQAAALIMEDAGISRGVNIYIEKNIPIAAGLAGGSTDAASVLIGLNKLFNLNYQYDELKKLGQKIGTDVPFCIKGGTALALNKGDELKQLPDLGLYNVLLINPDIRIETGEIYNKFDKMKPRVNIATQKLVSIIKSGKKIKWNEGWGNVLEPVTSQVTDEISEIKNILNQYQQVKFSMMTGSGPTIFAIIEDCIQAENIKRKWPRKKDELFIVSTLKKKNNIN